MQTIVIAVLRLFTWLQTQGPIGVVYYTLFLTAWTVACLPTTPLEISAGYTFSSRSAVIASVTGKTLGSVAAFMLGRTFIAPVLARRRAAAAAAAAAWDAAHPHEHHSHSHCRWGRLANLTSHLQHALAAAPAETIAMVRASPTPIAIKNYGLSLMPLDVVPTPVFAAITLAVNVPYSIAWSLTGSSASSLQDAVNGEVSVHNGVVAAKTFALVLLLSALGGFAHYCKSRLDAHRHVLHSPRQSPAKGTPKSTPAANGHSNGAAHKLNGKSD
mmetsp:Transcript_4384/g.11362  ORF Transcript_4384/g.11362 Transcript_4384/m.11362 type:complete len:272 (-) Transcript_4384:375-1190(-)